MAKAHHDHSPIAMPVATAVAGSLGQRLHLNLGEVFALPPLRVFRLARRNSSENWQWRRIGDKPESGCFPHVGIANSSENAKFRKSFTGRDVSPACDCSGSGFILISAIVVSPGSWTSTQPARPGIT